MPFGVEELLLRIVGDDRDAREKLRGLATELDAFARIHRSAEVDVNTLDAKARLGDFKRELDNLAAGTTDVRILADIAAARAEVDAFIIKLEKFDHSKYEADVGVNKSQMDELLQGFSGLADNIKRLTSASQGAEKETKGFFDRLASTGVNMGPFTTQLRVAVPLVVALSGVVSALAGALGALIASAAAAAGGLAAIGVAGAAALGPIGAMLIGVVTKLTQASQAQQAYKTAQQAVTSSSQQLKQAQDAVGQAQTQVQRSTQALTQARKTAAEQIRTDNVQAENQLRTAQEALSSSEFTAKQAEDALTQARVDARRALVDERLAAEGTALGHKAAVLNLIEARRQLATAEGGGDSLAIREARLAVQQAELQVTTTRVASGRAQRDLTKSEKDGVNGSPGVVSARRAVHDATQGVADATRQLHQAQDAVNKAQAESVAKSSQVVSAENQVADAHRTLAQAQERAAAAAADLATKQKAADKALRAFDASKVALGVTRTLNQFQRVFGKGVDAVLKGMERGLKGLLPLVRRLEPVWVKLGRTMGRAFIEVTRELARPVWQRFFTFLLRSSRQLVPLMTKGFIAFLRIMRNIARAAMPFLLEGMRKLVGFLQDVARGTRGINLDLVMRNLKVWVRLFLQLGRLFLNFVAIGAGPGRKLVAWLARGAKAMADWLGTKDGQKTMHLFFQRTVPLARDLAVFVGRLVILFLQLGEIMAPILDVAVKPLDTLLGLLIKAVDWLVKVTGGFKKWGIAIKVVAAVLATPVLFGTEMIQHWRDIPKLLAGIWGHIKDIASRLWGAIKWAITAPMHALGTSFRGIFGGLLDVLKKLWGGIKAAAQVFWKAIGHWIVFFPKTGYDDLKKDTLWITGVLSKLWGGIKRLAADIWTGVGHGIGHVVRNVYNWLINATKHLGDVFHTVWHSIAVIVNRALTVVHDSVHGIVKAINFIVGKLGDVKDKIAGALPSIGSSGISIPGVGSVDLTPGFSLGTPFGAQGMVVKSPTYVVGEEAPRHPEVVIPENPAYRGRALKLWDLAGQMLGIPGFKKGGVRYALPWPGGTSQFGELDQGIDVGGTGPVMAMDSGYVTKPNFNPFSSSGYGTPSSGLVYRMDHPPKGYAPSSPYVYIYELFNPRGSAHGRIHAGQILGSIEGGTGIEMGWATASGGTLAAALGEDVANRHSYPRGLPASISLQKFIADIQGGKHIAAGAAGAIAALLPRIKIKGVGPMAGVAQSAVNLARNAGNDYLSRIQARLQPSFGGGTSAAAAQGVTGGTLPKLAYNIARSLRAPREAVLALFEALWDESTMGQATSNVLEFKSGGTPHDQITAFLTRGVGYDDPEYGVVPGAIRGSQMGITPASRLAQALQGSFDPSGSNYQAQKGNAITTLRKLGYRGFATGVRNAAAGLAMVGENGPELLNLPAGTDVHDTDGTRKILDALAHGGGGHLRFVVNGDIVTDHPDPVQLFMGDKLVASFVRDIAADEADAAVSHLR